MVSEGKKEIHVAFVGNPNCGKTTLFNALTGSNIKVGNWPGVTMERVEGEVEVDGWNIHLADLPGTYSLESYTTEEQITRSSLENDQLDLIVNVVDATALERHLYLTLQLLQLGKPLVVVLNMVDMVQKQHILLDITKLSEQLGNIPVIAVSATKKYGFSDLFDTITKTAGIKLQIDSRKREVSYDQVNRILDHCFEKPFNQNNLTDRVDRFLTHPVFGIPAFLLIMVGVFWMTFAVGDWLKEYVQIAVTWISEALRYGLTAMNAADWIVSLTVDGIAAGVGVVMTFLPNLIILFIAMAIMEDSGYMARVAYVMNEVMELVGLSGKAFIPMLLGFGCTVPAIMSTRILASEQEKKKAMLLLPFMSCSAKLPIYLLFTAVFFQKYAFLVISFLYIFSFLIGILMMYLLHMKDSESEGQVLLIELPEYRMPDLLTVYTYVREKIIDYVLKAGSTIFAASVLLWVLLHMNWHGPAANVADSFAAMMGTYLVPVLKPLGLGYWQIAVALIAGLSAKEVVVASFAVLFGIQNLNSAEGISYFSQLLGTLGFGQLNAFVFLIFCLFYTPCISALAMIKRETRSWRWMLRMGALQIVAAWGMSFLFFQLGRMIF